MNYLKIRKVILILTSLSVLFFTFTATAAPTVGSIAPDFNLQDQHGKYHSLNNYKGKWVVLYFYPRDKTPGCTIEAASFRDQQGALSKRNAVVFGISTDDVESHLDFHKTLELNFNLLADNEKVVSKSYQVLNDFVILAYSRRQTFIIDPEGRVAHHFSDVDPNTHTGLVMKKLDELKDIYQ
jgi:peroxiredoxin Q/BCP